MMVQYLKGCELNMATTWLTGIDLMSVIIVINTPEQYKHTMRSGPVCFQNNENNQNNDIIHARENYNYQHM